MNERLRTVKGGSERSQGRGGHGKGQAETPMKAISIKQPYASQIARGEKTLEHRT